MTTISPPRWPDRPDAAAAAPRPAAPRGTPPGSVTPTEAVPALLGALAVLGGTLAIPPMISGGEWFWYTAEVVAVIWLVGVGARLTRAPGPVVVLLQLIAAGIAMTALFTVRGYGGVIPNGAVLTEVGDLLTGAWSQIRSTVSPAPSSTELSFLICISVAATALIVDMLIAWCRAPALVALPLLCLYAVPASIDVSMLPWQAFAAPAVLYAMLLVATGLAGRRIGAGAGVAQVASGFVVACVCTVVALLVADAVTGIGTTGRLPRTTTGASAGVGLSPFTSLRGNLEQGSPVDLFRVSGLPGPAYLRAVGLEQWTPNQGWSIDQLDDGPFPDQPIAADQTKVSVTPLNYFDEFLPIYNGATAIGSLDAGWAFDSALESVHRPDKITPNPYQVTASFGQPSADELRSDIATAGGALLDTGGDLRPEVIARAVEVTSGATTAFDKADRLRAYFTDPANGFTYSLQVPAGDSGDLLLDFLHLKQGYCEQYATAMAVMLRAVGVPARVAVGFTQGVPDAAGDYLISSHDAHAWVEVPFDGTGWVEFDPTPLGEDRGGQQGFTEEAGTTQPTPTAGAGATGATAGEEVPEPGAGPTRTDTSRAPAAAGSSGNDGPAIPTGLWWVLLLALLLGAAVAGPTVVRRQRRNRRLAIADAGGPGAAGAAWREIEDLAIDHRIVLDSAQSARACANRLAKSAHLTVTGRNQLRDLVGAAERGWYAGADTSSRSTAEAPVGMIGTMAQTPVGATTDTMVGTAGGFGAAPRTLAVELAHAASLSLIDRIVPRSVRPGWWRG